MLTRIITASGFILTLTLAASSPALAQGAVTPEEVKNLYECAEESNPMERLACYDKEVADIRQKLANSDIAFADKYEFKDVYTTIVGATQFGRGKWSLVLEDGSRWLQTEASRLRRVELGMPVTITKSGFGGFRARINDRHTIKVKRVD